MITIPTPVDPAFSPPTTTANEDALNTQAEAFVSNLGRIIGQRGTEVSTQMTTTAVDFSQLVAEPLRTNGATFLAAAEAASEGAAHGSEVTAQLATAVTTFKQEISRLVNEWNAAAPLFGASPPTPENVAAAKQEMLDLLNPQATAAHEALLDAADTANGMLTSGPTPANLQALAAGAGGGSWLMFNLFGGQAGPPPVNGPEGGALAGQIRDHLANGTPLTPDMFNVLRSIGLHAQDLQAAGAGELNPGQIAYLQQLFEGLDQPFDPNLPIDTNMLYHLPEMIGNSGLSGTDQSMMLGAVGGGVLALSNNQIGGGRDLLPGTVQGLIRNYFGAGGTTPVDRANQLNALGAFLGATSHEGVGLDRLEGGDLLSAALTLSVADANAVPGLNGMSIDGLDLAQLEHADLEERAQLAGVGEQARIDLLSAATRNTEVNGKLLTGLIAHPEYGPDTPEYLVRSIFGHDWQDDGKAAAGLIDWISDPDLPESQSDLATESAYNLFTLSTNHTTSADQPDPGRWDVSTYDLLADGFGRVPLFDSHGNPAGAFEAAPLGVANPEIAQAMARAVVVNLGYFDDSESGYPSALIPSAEPGATGMYLDMDTRRDFFELAMGDKDAADLLGATVYGRMLNESSNAPFWGVPPGGDPNDVSLDYTEEVAESLGTRDGILASLLDHGYTALLTDAQGDADWTTVVNNQEALWIRGGSTLLKEGVDFLPGGKLARTGLKLLFEAGKIGPVIAQGYDAAWGTGETPTDMESAPPPLTPENLKLGTAHGLVESLLQDPDSGIDMEDVIAIDKTGLVVTQDGAGLRSAEELMRANVQGPEGYGEDSITARQILEQVIGKSCYHNAEDNLDVFVQSFDDRRQNG